MTIRQINTEKSDALIALIEYVQNYKNYTKSTKKINSLRGLIKKNTDVISSSHLLAVLAWQLLFAIAIAIEFAIVDFAEFELFD